MGDADEGCRGEHERSAGEGAREEGIAQSRARERLFWALGRALRGLQVSPVLCCVCGCGVVP